MSNSRVRFTHIRVLVCFAYTALSLQTSSSAPAERRAASRSKSRSPSVGQRKSRSRSRSTSRDHRRQGLSRSPSPLRGDQTGWQPPLLPEVNADQQQAGQQAPSTSSSAPQIDYTRLAQAMADIQRSSSSSASRHSVTHRSRSRSPRRHRSSSSSSSSRHSERRRSRSRSRRSKSKTRSRSRSHSRSRSSRSSRSSESRSRSRSRHRKSRSRSPSPPPLRDGHDPLSLDFKQVSSRVLKDLNRGKNVHIDKCIRQHQSARVDQHLGSIGGINLSTSNTKARTVKTNIDWLEAMLSSILPVLIAQANAETTIEGVKSKLAQIERHTSYCLAAVFYFQRFDFHTVKNYLEAHRDACWINNGDVSEPNTSMLNIAIQRSTQSSSSTSSSSNSSSSSSSSASSSRTNTNKPHSSSKKPYNADQCGRFNSFDGCPKKPHECGFKHACRHCKADGHGQTNCAEWKKLNPRKK